MDADAMRCPTCGGPLGDLEVEGSTGTWDRYCDSCSALLRLRFFRGEIVDIEDLDLSGEALSG